MSEDPHALLRELYQAGKGDFEIACELGISVNAVIGRRFRLGLKADRRQPEVKPVLPPEPKPPEASPVFVKPRPVAKKPHNEYFRKSRKVATNAVELIEAGEPKPEATVFGFELPKRVTLLELEVGMCRWPLGDPKDDSFRYCGNPIHHGSYCQHHGNMASTGRVSKPVGERVRFKLSSLTLRR